MIKPFSQRCLWNQSFINEVSWFSKRGSWEVRAEHQDLETGPDLVAKNQTLESDKLRFESSIRVYWLCNLVGPFVLCELEFAIEVMRMLIFFLPLGANALQELSCVMEMSVLLFSMAATQPHGALGAWSVCCDRELEF